MEEEQVKKQFILNEEKELTEIPKSLCAAVKYPIKCKLKNAFEVFVRVKHTENYWISNYGRCVNNANRKDKTTFYEHKQGKCHYSIFEMEKSIVSYPARLLKSGKLKVDRKKQKFEKIVGAISDEECQAIISELQEKNEKKIYEIERNKYRRETSPEELVAEHFLKRSGCRTRIWHKDGDENNNWYKNLMYVGVYDYADLKKGKINWYELGYKQEYIEYENKTNYIAYRVYNSIKERCGDISNKKIYTSVIGMLLCVKNGLIIPDCLYSGILNTTILAEMNQWRLIKIYLEEMLVSTVLTTAVFYRKL